MTTNGTNQRDADRVRKDLPGHILRCKPDIKGFLVIQQLSNDTTPYLYRVTHETQIDGSESLHWAFLGRVEESETPDARTTHTQ